MKDKRAKNMLMMAIIVWDLGALASLMKVIIHSENEAKIRLRSELEIFDWKLRTFLELG